MWFWIFLLAVISIYNTIYSFLPENLKNNLWIKLLGIITALGILIYGLCNIFSTYNNYTFAYVSKDGKILKQKNFRWIITKTTKDNYPLFIINERYGDASDVKVIPDKPRKIETYNAIDGVAVTFLCTDDQLVNFKLIINK